MTKDTRLMTLCSVIFLMSVWLMIVAWFLFGRNRGERPDYTAAFDQAFF